MTHLAAALVAMTLAAGDSGPDLEKLCKQIKCRSATKVTLIVDGKSTSDVDIPASPIVYDRVVNVIAGETLYLEANVAENGTIALKAVDEISNPELTITIKFGQLPSETGVVQTVLAVVHPFKKKMLKYRCAVQYHGAPGFASTPVCPVFPGVTGWEFWPDPIVQLLMLDLRLVDAESESERVCE